MDHKVLEADGQLLYVRVQETSFGADRNLSHHRHTRAWLQQQ